MASLAGYWTVEGDHLKVVQRQRPRRGAGRRRRRAARARGRAARRGRGRRDDRLIFSGGASEAAVDRLRRLGPGTATRGCGPWCRLLLALTDRTTRASRRRCSRSCAPTPTRRSRGWRCSGPARCARTPATSPARSPPASRRWRWPTTRRARGRGRCSPPSWPGSRSQSGDRAAGERYARRALPGHGAARRRPRTSPSSAALLAFVGHRDRAGSTRPSASSSGSPPTSVGQSMIGGFMVLPCGVAELALARGDVERGLDAYREAAETMRERRFPGLEMNSGFEPWVLFPEAGAVAAHARHGRCPGPDAGCTGTWPARRPRCSAATAASSTTRRPARWLRAGAVGPAAARRARRGRAGGAAAGAGGPVRLQPDAADAELAAGARRGRGARPGLLDAVRAELAPRTVVDLRDDVLRRSPTSGSRA